MTFAVESAKLVRTRQELLVIGARECQNSYATLVQQLLTRTEELDHADWTKTSTTVSADSATDPIGSDTADVVTFNALNDAIGQTVTGTAVTSKAFTGSIWLKRNPLAGVQRITLRIRNVAGTESGTNQVIVPATWTRFWVHKLFSGTPVDDVVFEIAWVSGSDDSLTPRVWGANLYENPGDVDRVYYFPYRKRVAEAVATVSVNAGRCNATDAGDGARCFYSRPTCQDPDNFNAGNSYEATASLRGIREDRFCKKDAALALPGEAITPSVISSPRASQEIDPERSVTVNESITYELQDDAGPGVWNLRQQGEGMLVNTARGVGTFWTRWLAIYGNFSNPECYALRKVGYVEAGATEDDFQTRGEYLIRRVELSDFMARIKCADRLRLLKTSTPPKASDTNIVTSFGYIATDTSLNVSDASEITTPAANAASASPDYVVTLFIDEGGSDEEKVNVTAISGNTLTVQRGRWGTTAPAFATGGTSFVEVVEFGTEDATPSNPPTGKNPIDITIELLKRGGIAAADIDTTTLEADRDAWISSDIQLLDDVEAMDGAAWTGVSVTVTADAVEAPDGAMTADNVQFNADNDALYQQVTGEAVTSKAFTGSVYLSKSGGGAVTITIRVRNVANTQSGIKQVTVTPDVWTRVMVHKLFTGVPVDDVVFEIIRLAGDSVNGNIHVWGANLWRNTDDTDAEQTRPYRSVQGAGPLWRRTVTEPTDIEGMLKEIRDTIQLFLFVNGSQMVSGRLYEHDVSTVTLTDDEHIIADSVSITHEHEDRLTRVLLAYGLTAGADAGDLASYTKVHLEIDAGAEDRGYYGGDFRQKKILSPWVPAAETFSPAYFPARILGRYRHGTRTISFRLEVKDDDIDIGDYVTIDSAQITDAFGVNLAPVCIVTKKREMSGNEIEFEALIVEDFWEIT